MTLKAADKNSVTAVDFFKCLFALTIVAIHTKLLTVTDSTTAWYVNHLFFRLAVPYFFVASGYFYGSKLNKSYGEAERKIAFNRYFRRNFPPFLFWGFLGLCLYAISLFRGKEPDIAVKLLQTVVFYPRAAMWFLLACIIAAAIYTKFWEKRKTVFLIGIIGYMFTLLCNSYFSLVENTAFAGAIEAYLNVCLSARNFAGVGLIFIGTGISLSHINVEKVKMCPLILATLALFVILFAEVRYISDKTVLDDSSCFFTSPLISAALMIISLKIKLPYSVNISKSIRQLSAYLFFLHSFFNNTVGDAITALGFNCLVRFVAVVLLCVLMFVITKDSKNKYIRLVLP